MENIKIDGKIEHIRRYEKPSFRNGILVFYDNLDKVWKIVDGETERKTKNYQHVGSFFNGFATVKENDKLGFINTLGEEVVHCKYKSYKMFKDGLAAVQDDHDLWGFVNANGEEVIPCQYTEVSNFSEGLAAVQDSKSGLWGFIDKIGKVVISCYYSFVSDFHDGIALIGKYNRYGAIDKDGNIVVSCKYKAIQEISEGLMAVKDCNTDYWGYVDKYGVLKIPFAYSHCGSFRNGMAYAYDLINLYGHINKAGTRISSKYSQVDDFHEGLAKVSAGNQQWNFINRDGKLISETWFKKVSDFQAGLAVVVNGSGQYGVIDREGNTVIQCKYEEIFLFPGGKLIIVGRNQEGKFLMFEDNNENQKLF